jgi:hypothetical protein
MKKKMIALLAGALLTLGMAGNALAYFGNGELNLYAYSNLAASNEVGIDLGSMTSLLASGTTTTITAGESALTGLKSGASFVYAGLYGFDAATTNVWVVANQGLSPFAANLSNFANFQTANSLVNTGYSAATGQVNSFGPKGTTATNDYFGKLDKAVNGQATYASLIAATIGGDFRTTLAADVVKSIYLMDVQHGSTNFVDTGATATFKTNGDIVIAGATATPTPVPPSFFLMGSGLLGMIGLRRKKA